MAKTKLPITEENSEEVTFASLDRALISDILILLEPDSLRQVRLVNQQLKQAADEHITSLNLASPKYCNRFEDSESVVKNWRRWPKLKKLKLTLEKCVDTPIPTASLSDMILTQFIHAKWSLEEISLHDSGVGPHGALSISKAVELHWHRLRVIDLSYNRLGYAGPAALFLVDYPFLEFLDISGNKIGGDDLSPSCLAIMAMKCPNLRHLNLSFNGLRDVDIEAVAKSGDFPHLKQLNLEGNKLSPQSCGFLAEAAPRWPSLRDLRLTFNRIGAQGLEDLLQGVPWNFERLCIDFIGQLSIQNAAVLCLSSIRSTLQTLILGGNILEAEFFEVLLQAEWPKLENFCFTGNDLGPDEAAVLAAASEHLPALKSLAVEDLGPEGFEELMDVVWPKLEVLLVSGVHWPPGLRGVQALAEAAEQHRLPELKDLNLRFSSLDAVKIQTLLSATWPKLERLDVGSSSFGNRGAMAIGAASARLPALQELNLDECSLGTKGMSYLFHGDWKSLERVDISAPRGTTGLPKLPKRLTTKWEMEIIWETKAVIKRKHQ